MYRCVRCDDWVSDDDRVAHSASKAHQANGGKSDVDEEDYESTPDTRGSSKTR